MEVVFEYEFDGIEYPEDNPPPKLINDLLDALEPFLQLIKPSNIG